MGTASTSKRIRRVALPAAMLALLLGPLACACLFLWNVVVVAGGGGQPMILLLRAAAFVAYFAAFLVGMEYVARYEHQAFWHGPGAWFLHASHHHCEAAFGSTPNRQNIRHTVLPQGNKGSWWENNDIFPVIFACLTVPVFYWTILVPPTNTLCKDCCLGMALGISSYGLSYAVGHDLCAHERGGAELAAWLRRTFPAMAACADLHVVHHHRIDNKGAAATDEDPYGPPYGFWLGAQELELAGKRKRGEVVANRIVPVWCQLVFASAFGFLAYAAATGL
jgi:hypothetical protein